METASARVNQAGGLALSKRLTGPQTPAMMQPIPTRPWKAISATTTTIKELLAMGFCEAALMMKAGAKLVKARVVMARLADQRPDGGQTVAAQRIAPKLYLRATF
jgi:hypothetical protein